MEKISMQTNHKIVFGNAQNMEEVKDESITLVVTSPPYPMIEMWDTIFNSQNPKIKDALENGDGKLAFNLMNDELDKVWDELYRVLIPGGMACINIGDATRTINKNFQLYSNHSRFLHHLLKIGFQTLPDIIWRKQTNAPNKFMGSGMLPPGAYVTLEHEFILILRKGQKREFKRDNEKSNRYNSSYFWEERNNWFSDIWEFKGTEQRLKNNKTRERSAAYPFELAFRLINMFSVKSDTILDPFLGTSTSTIAAMASGRHSIGFEIDSTLKEIIFDKVRNSLDFSNDYINNRLKKHIIFVEERKKAEKEFKYINKHYNFPVITNQEVNLTFNTLKSIQQNQDLEFTVNYEEIIDKESFSNQFIQKIKSEQKSQKSLSKFL